MKKLATLGLLLALTQVHGAASPFEMQARQWAEQLETVRRNSEAIWPGGERFREASFVVTNGREAFELTNNGAEAFPLEHAAQFVNINQNLAYQFSPSESRAYFVFGEGLNYSPEIKFSFFTHEGFHFFYQRGWNTTADLRYSVYPLELEPRVYRHAIYSILLNLSSDALERENQLDKAAFLFRYWKENYPEDALRGSISEIIEGSATYFAVRAMLSADVSFQGIQDFIDSRREVFPLAGGSDGEGYTIGALAGLRLEQLRLSRSSQQVSDWRWEVARGTSPLELLLGSRKPVETSVPQESRAFAEMFAENLEKYYGVGLQKVLRLWESGAPALQLSTQTREGTSMGMWFVSPKIPNAYILPFYETTFFTSFGDLLLEDVFLVSIVPRTYWLLLDSEDIEKDGDVLYFASSLLGRLPLEELAESSGRMIYRIKIE